MLPECEIKIGLDPAAQDSPAVLEVRREIPSAGVWQICMEYSLAELTWPSKTDQGSLEEAEVSVTML